MSGGGKGLVNVFTVVGDHKVDDARLLVLGPMATITVTCHGANTSPLWSPIISGASQRTAMIGTCHQPPRLTMSQSAGLPLHNSGGNVTMLEFLVIGGLKDEHGHLLLVGNDGQFYVYDADRAEVTMMIPGTSWEVGVIECCSLVFEAPAEMVAS